MSSQRERVAQILSEKPTSIEHATDRILVLVAEDRRELVEALRHVREHAHYGPETAKIISEALGEEMPECTCFNGHTSSVCPVHSGPEPAKPKRYRCKGCGKIVQKSELRKDQDDYDVHMDWTVNGFCGPVEEEI